MPVDLLVLILEVGLDATAGRRAGHAVRARDAQGGSEGGRESCRWAPKKKLAASPPLDLLGKEQVVLLGEALRHEHIFTDEN